MSVGVDWTGVVRAASQTSIARRIDGPDCLPVNLDESDVGMWWHDDNHKYEWNGEVFVKSGVG